MKHGLFSLWFWRYKPSQAKPSQARVASLVWALGRPAVQCAEAQIGEITLYTPTQEEERDPEEETGSQNPLQGRPLVT